MVLDGHLLLMTPEGISLSLVPAGPARRAIAWLIDLLLWGAGLWLCLFLIGIAFGRSTLGSGFSFVLLFVSYWGYPILFEVYASGKTPGKRWMGLEVVRSNGLPVGWRESCLRNLLLVVDFMPFLYATGLVAMLSDQRFRRVGDWVADTMVIYSPKPEARALHQSEPALALPFPLSPEQQRALIDLVERAERLSEERRLELADLAEPLTGLRGQASLQRLRSYVAGLTQ